MYFSKVFLFYISFCQPPPPTQALPCGKYGGGSEPINQWAHIWLSSSK
jgi:hypothetical protein